MIKTIGLFGDSFCALETTPHSEQNEYESYIRQLRNHYTCDIVHLGEPSTGVWDLYLNQLLPFLSNNEYPDVSVFVWTNPSKFFHRTVRTIHGETIELVKSGADFGDKEIWEAAQLYYEKLRDVEKDVLEYLSFLEYLDNNIFANWPNNKKIIHAWSFGKYRYINRNNEPYELDKVDYHRRWKNGVEIRPPLMWAASTEKWPADGIPNHINGQERNKIVADTIINAIDNYQSGQLYNII